jgi:hypothetical protein
MSSKINESLEIPDLLYLKNNMDKHNIYYSLLKLVTEKIRLIPNYEILKNEIELVLLVCNIIENVVKKNNKTKIDKKQLVIDIFTTVFGNQIDILSLKITIDFLFNNKLIKQISLKKYIKSKSLYFIVKLTGL